MHLTHIRIDHEELNSKSRFACGIAWPLPEGDTAWFAGESSADRATCLKCNPNPRQLGTPISQLSGRPGHPGFEEFCDIARSWGYD